MVDEKLTKLVQDILGPEAYAIRRDNIYTGGEYFKICSPNHSKEAPTSISRGGIATFLSSKYVL